MRVTLTALLLVVLTQTPCGFRTRVSDANQGLIREKPSNKSIEKPFIGLALADSFSNMEVDNPTDKQKQNMYGILQHLYAGLPLNFKPPRVTQRVDFNESIGLVINASTKFTNSNKNSNRIGSSLVGTRDVDMSGTWRLYKVAGHPEKILTKMFVHPVVVFTLKHLKWGVGEVFETIGQTGDDFIVATTTYFSHQTTYQNFTVGEDYTIEDGNSDDVTVSTKWKNETKDELQSTYTNDMFEAELIRVISDGELQEKLTVFGTSIGLYYEKFKAE